MTIIGIIAVIVLAASVYAGLHCAEEGTKDGIVNTDYMSDHERELLEEAFGNRKSGK